MAPVACTRPAWSPPASGSSAAAQQTSTAAAGKGKDEHVRTTHYCYPAKPHSRNTSTHRLTHRDTNRAALLSRTPAYANTPSIPNYGRSYEYSSPAQFPLSSSSFSNHRTAEDLESQNDDAIEGLSAKVRLLKEITVNIGTEVKESTNLISTLNDTFSEATGLLSGTFKKMNRMAKKQYGRWWYWFLFLIAVFWIFVLTWLWRR